MRYCIGLNLNLLIREEFDVYALSRVAHLRQIANLHWLKGDLLDTNEPERIIKDIKPDCLLHLGWCTTPDIYWESPENKIWLQASIDLLKAFQENGGQRMVIAGSCAEYQWHSKQTSLEENSVLNPMSRYSKAKCELFEILQNGTKIRAANFAWARLFFLYGRNENRQKFVAQIICNLLEEKVVSIKNRDLRRDYLHVDDAAKALVKLLISDLQGAVNIGSGIAAKLGDIAIKIGEKLSRQSLLNFASQEVRELSQPSVVANIQKIKDMVGWIPTVDLDSGLEKSIQWWKENRYDYAV